MNVSMSELSSLVDDEVMNSVDVAVEFALAQFAVAFVGIVALDVVAVIDADEVVDASGTVHRLGERYFVLQDSVDLATLPTMVHLRSRWRAHPQMFYDSCTFVAEFVVIVVLVVTAVVVVAVVVVIGREVVVNLEVVVHYWMKIMALGEVVPSADRLAPGAPTARERSSNEKLVDTGEALTGRGISADERATDVFMEETSI